VFCSYAVVYTQSNEYEARIREMDSDRNTLAGEVQRLRTRVQALEQQIASDATDYQQQLRDTQVEFRMCSVSLC